MQEPFRHAPDCGLLRARASMGARHNKIGPLLLHVVCQNSLGCPLFEVAFILQSGHAIGSCEIHHFLLSHPYDTLFLFGLNDINGSVCVAPTPIGGDFISMDQGELRIWEQGSPVNIGMTRRFREIHTNAHIAVLTFLAAPHSEDRLAHMSHDARRRCQTASGREL